MYLVRALSSSLPLIYIPRLTHSLTPLTEKCEKQKRQIISFAFATHLNFAASTMECIANLIDKGSVESSRYFLSRGTVLEMLADRGYDVVQHANLVSTLSDFRSRFGQQPNHEALGFCVSHLSNPSNTVRTFLSSLIFPSLYFSSSFWPAGSGCVCRNRYYKNDNRHGNMQPNCRQWKLEIAHNHSAEQNHFLRTQKIDELALQSWDYQGN